MAPKSANHVVVWMNFLKDAINEGDPTILGVLTAVVILVVTFLIFGIFKQRGNKGRGVLLLGCCDSGKSLLFSQLVYKKYKQTVTSMTANSGDYTVTETNKSLRVIDITGQEQVRYQILDQYKQFTRAIMFVVDSSSIQKEIKDIAEYLYTVLSDSKISNASPPLLIVCNKQDLTFSKGAKVIQSQLEKEMNNLRVTKSAALQDLSSGNNNTYLGKRSSDFTFNDLRPLMVEFAECSALGKEAGGEPDMSQVQDWLAKIA